MEAAHKCKQIFQKEYHEVQPGDTLIGLALKYGVTVAEIRAANKNITGSTLQPGQTISILTAREVPPGEMVADPRVAVDAAFAADDDEDDGYAAAAADFKVRNFLKVKQGPLLRYFNQGYEPRWIYLVDQHILDFENEASVVPSRIYELKYPHTVVVRNGTDIQITFTKSKRNHKTVRLFLRAETEEEAVDWHAIMDAISRKRLGTSAKDDARMPFHEYFRVVTLSSTPAAMDRLSSAFPEESKQFPMYNFSLAGFLNGPQYGTAPAFLQSGVSLPADGEAYIRSSLTASDLLLDDALDAISDVFSVDSTTVEAIEVLLNSFNSRYSTDRRMQDRRLIALKDSWIKLPNWFQPELCERGREVLNARADSAIRGCIFGTIAILLTAPQTVYLLNFSTAEASPLSPEYCQKMAERYVGKDCEKIPSDILALVDSGVAVVLDALLNLCSYQEKGTGREYTFKDSLMFYNGHLCRGSPAWEKLTRARTYFAIIRRKAMSLFGVERWSHEDFGLPFSQAYNTFLISVFTSAMLESVPESSIEDKKAILMMCRYVAHLMGYDISRADYVWAECSDIKRIAAASCTFFSQNAPEVDAALASLRKVQNLRTSFFPERAPLVLWKFPGNQFDYFLTEACGIDFAYRFACSSTFMGRFGLYLWMLCCRFFYSFFRFQPFTSGTSSGMGDNCALLGIADALLPGMCEDDEDLIGVKAEHFVERRNTDLRKMFVE